MSCFWPKTSTPNGISEHFQNHQVHKEYLAIVIGRPPNPSAHPGAGGRGKVSIAGAAGRREPIGSSPRSRTNVRPAAMFPQNRRHAPDSRAFEIDWPSSLAVDPLYNPPLLRDRIPVFFSAITSAITAAPPASWNGH